MNLFEPREKFLVLEVTPKGTHGLFLGVDDDRTIHFEKFQKNVDVGKIIRSIFQKTWEGRYLFRSHRRVIVAADPVLATTIPIPLDLQRERTAVKAKITVAELENLIAQEMAKIFNGCRSEAARRLRVNDLDAVLVGARAKDFMLDGKEVGTPEGFAGGKIELLLELTFTTRRISREFQSLFSSPEGFFFAEGPQAHAVSLMRAGKFPLNIIVAGEPGAALFVLQKAKGRYAVLYREALEWSFASFIKAIAEGFAVSEKTAREMYRLYRKEGISAPAARFLKKMLEPAVEDFWKELGRAKVSGTVYIDAPEGLPFSLPHRRDGVTVENHPVGDILAGLGFTVDPRAIEDGKSGRRRSLIYFLEAYFDKMNTDINQKLRRRLHWLAE